MKKFNLDIEGCSKCGPAHQHFIDPRSHYDTLTEQGITWVQSSKANMQSSFPKMKTTMHDPSNIKCKHPIDRPKGFIKVKRQCKKIEDHGEFMQIAKQATARILKKHQKQSSYNTRSAIQTKSRYRWRIVSITG